MPATTYREALREAHREALQRDPRVFLMGEDVGRYGGSCAVSKGLLGEFDEDRIRDTPLSEPGFVGAGIGAALGGIRQIVEIMTVNFSLLAMDPIVNTATLEDACGMLWPALQDPDPVLIFEHAQLYNLVGELADPPPAVDIASAAVRRAGRDLTIVTYGGSLPRALEAAQLLAAVGTDAEVIDLRVLRPLDSACVLASVRKTHRLLVVDEAWCSGSLAAEVMARVAEEAFYELDAPPARVCGVEVPVPYAKHLEDAALPLPPCIVAAARVLLARRA